MGFIIALGTDKESTYVALMNEFLVFKALNGSLRMEVVGRVLQGMLLAIFDQNDFINLCQLFQIRTMTNSIGKDPG